MFLVSFFQAFLDYEFIRYATYAGIIVGLLAPLIGTVVVVRRLSFIADTVSHFSLAGVCLGTLLSKFINNEFFNPLLLGIVFSILATFLIEKIRSFYKNYKELSMPIVMSFGVALSGLFISLSDNVDSKYTHSLLYGSIYSVDSGDIIIILIIAVAVFLFAITSYKKVVTLCFDETYARISGVNVCFLQLAITTILSIVISLFIEIIGVLLIASLMIIPVAAAILIGDSYLHTTILSIIFSEISIVSGFVISYHFDVTTGPIIILINILILLIILLCKKISRLKLKEKIEI